MSETLLGKRHNYQPNEADSLANRAKQLGFSAEEIVELARLYGGNFEEVDKVEVSLTPLDLIHSAPVRS